MIVWIHGGGWRQGSKESGGHPPRLPKIVETGRYFGASINYRLSAEQNWPAQLFDCKAAIRWLRAKSYKYGYDGRRISVWGSSAGGHLALMLGTTNGKKEWEGSVGSFKKYSSEVQSVINYYGPSEFLKMDNHPSIIVHSSPNSPESKLLGRAIGEVPKMAKQASPFHHVKEGLPPFIHFHGTKDMLVPYNQSFILHQKILSHKNDSRLITVRGGGHKMPENFTEKFVLPFLDFHFLGIGTPVNSQEIVPNN